MTTAAKLLWEPDARFKAESQLVDYMHWLAANRNRHFANYAELWQWSITATADFWESIWDYFAIKAHHPYQSVLEGEQMPWMNWFKGSTLNYAEHIFRQANPAHPALLFQSERSPLSAISWQELAADTARLQHFLKATGLSTGDRVAAILPNIPEATVAFLASNAMGAVWSSCSPDFGAEAIIDRFQQIEPKVLIAVDGYTYNGKAYDKTEVIEQIADQLPSVEIIIFIPYLNSDASLNTSQSSVNWQAALRGQSTELTFTPVPFEHPVWVLYSSGTTGRPKAITHSHGGVLLEHLKYHGFHNDTKAGERYFWYTTTGWMMWNFVQAALLRGATIVLYDGSPGYPDLDVLWDLAEKAGIQHFGCSAPYLVSCMKQQLQPGEKYDLSRLRSLSSTGAPLPPETFAYIYSAIKKDLWLCSMSGGTDVCTAFVGGNPLLAVRQGEIQSRALGCALYAYDDAARPVTNQVGEMVITRPMPSMPVYFWNDPSGDRYLNSYFAQYPGIWRHGDWVRINDQGSLVIYGRSDATLNRQGIRIGTAEIYRSLHKIPEIEDSLIVNLELPGGRHFMPLFVLLPKGQELNAALRQKINQQLRLDYTSRHVPDAIVQVPDIPYTISGKKMETPVKKLLMGISLAVAANKDAMKNPSAMDFFIHYQIPQ